MNLSANVKVTQILGYYAAGTTARKASIVDMSDYDGCMFIYEFGTLLNTGTLDCFVSGDAANSTNNMARLLTTTAFTVGATQAAYTQSAIVVDIYQPDPVLHRYLEAQVVPAVANAVITGITAIQYSGRIRPTANDVSILKTTLLQSPGE